MNCSLFIVDQQQDSDWVASWERLCKEFSNRRLAVRVLPWRRLLEKAKAEKGGEIGSVPRIVMLTEPEAVKEVLENRNLFERDKVVYFVREDLWRVPELLDVAEALKVVPNRIFGSYASMRAFGYRESERNRVIPLGMKKPVLPDFDVRIYAYREHFVVDVAVSTMSIPELKSASRALGVLKARLEAKKKLWIAVDGAGSGPIGDGSTSFLATSSVRTRGSSRFHYSHVALMGTANGAIHQRLPEAAAKGCPCVLLSNLSSPFPVLDAPVVQVDPESPRDLCRELTLLARWKDRWTRMVRDCLTWSRDRTIERSIQGYERLLRDAENLGSLPPRSSWRVQRFLYHMESNCVDEGLREKAVLRSGLRELNELKGKMMECRARYLALLRSGGSS